MARKGKSGTPGPGGDDDDDEPVAAEDAAKPGEPKPETKPAVTDEKKAEDGAPKVEPWPDSTPAPMKPVEAPKPEAASTLQMPAAVDVKPPDMPAPTPPRAATNEVEDRTFMPGPREIPGGEPTDPAPAPGIVPRGDSRSFRRGGDFALIYRVKTFVICRWGVVGMRGQWRVVEYPTLASASHAYAQEASRFVSEGFSDYRE